MLGLLATIKNFTDSNNTGDSSTKKLVYGFLFVIVVIMLIIVIPNTSSILERLGFKTKATYQTEATLLKQQVELLTTANANLSNDVTNLGKQNEINETTIKELNQKLKDRSEQSVKTITKIDKKIKIIKASTTATAKEVDAAIAEVYIDELWSNYNTVTGVKQ